MDGWDGIWECLWSTSRGFFLSLFCMSLFLLFWDFLLPTSPRFWPPKFLHSFSISDKQGKTQTQNLALGCSRSLWSLLKTLSLVIVKKSNGNKCLKNSYMRAVFSHSAQLSWVQSQHLPTTTTKSHCKDPTCSYSHHPQNTADIDGIFS